MWTGLIDHSTLYGALRLDAERYDKASSSPTTSHGHGTGFVIGAELGPKRDRATYLVTNRHVVDPAFGPERDVTRGQGSLTVSGYMQSRVSFGTPPQPIYTKFALADSIPIFPSDPDLDLALVRFEDRDVDVIVGDGKVNRFDERALVAPWAYGDGDVHAGTQVLAAGYPKLGNQSGVTRPILVSGVASSDPRFPAEFAGAKRRSTVLCQSFSQSGMSGAPIFAPVQKSSMSLDNDVFPKYELAIIGVNAGHIRTADASDGIISHFVSSTALLELLAQQGSQHADFLVELARTFEAHQKRDY